MRSLAILSFVTLDGVMQAPSSPEEDNTGDFRAGGWARPFWDEVMEQVEREAMAEPYDLLLGRKTYDIFAPHFAANRDDPGARRLNEATKYVVTSRQAGLNWDPSIPLTGDIAEGIAALKRQAGPLLQVHGSCQLIQLLFAHRLVDEFRLWIFPVVAGYGKRLFQAEADIRDLSLLKTDTTSSGVVMAIYRPKD